MINVRSLRELGAAIRNHRRLAGLNQQQLADKAGVSRRWVSAVENAERDQMDVSAVLRTFEALGLVLSIGPDEALAADNILDEEW